ncbi:MAG: SET domain-containing protein-lysine N-methyltransferase [Myxococcota bacterium]
MRFLLLLLSLNLSAYRSFDSEYEQASKKILGSCTASEKAKKLCKLTPVHKAVLAGNLKALKDLAADGAKIDGLARSGFTPAHFAALAADRKMLDTLYDLGASRTVRDANGGTPDEIWNRTHIEDAQVNLWNDELSAVEAITGEEFTSRTGARFVTSIKISPLTLAKEWMDGFRPVPSGVIAAFKDGITKSYRSFEADRSPKLYIKKVDDAVGYGLFASQDFKKGDIIAEYEGEWMRKPPTVDSDYNTPNVDGAHLRGYAAFAAHGLPNAFHTQHPKTGGLQMVEVLVASRDIKAHEAIMWNYGTHEIIWEMYKEQSPAKLDAHILKNGLKFASTGFSWENMDNQNIFVYVMQTPTVFFRLLFEQRIPADELQFILEHELLGMGSHDPIFAALRTRTIEAIRLTDGMGQAERKVLWDFLAERAAEGNSQIFIQFLGSIQKYLPMLPKYSDLAWRKTWVDTCDVVEKDSKYAKRGDCRNPIVSEYRELFERKNDL